MKITKNCHTPRENGVNTPKTGCDTFFCKLSQLSHFWHILLNFCEKNKKSVNLATRCDNFCVTCDTFVFKTVTPKYHLSFLTKLFSLNFFFCLRALLMATSINARLLKW